VQSPFRPATRKLPSTISLRHERMAAMPAAARRPGPSIRSDFRAASARSEK